MLLKLYKYLNLLSIDVAIGSCICSVYISTYLNIQVDWTAITVLGLTVWLIYTFDHLQDGLKIKGIANTDRHRFHQKYFRGLVITSAIVLIIISIMVFNLPKNTVVMGVSLACLVLAYFMLLHFLGLKASYHKEILVAVIYTCGIFLAPMSVYNGVVELVHVMLFFQFVNMAFLNLIIFSWLETEKDRSNGFPSLVSVIGKKWATRVIMILIFTQLVVSLVLIDQFGMIDVSYIVLSMTSVLGVIAFFSDYFSKKERYRLWGDFVFIVPLIALL